MAEASEAALPQAGSAERLLSVENLHAWYGESHALHGVTFEVKSGEVVTLLGRNGAGKTTTLKSILGIVPKRSGSVLLYGNETINMPTRSIARLGIGYVPEERGIYSSLSVLENLTLPPRLRSGGLTLDEILDLFPNLRERLSSQGTKLSGGEQQMLAIGRVLHTGARLLLLDEPTEGLAPVIVQQIGDIIARLKRNGFTIVLVEQNLQFTRAVADRHYLVENGRVADMIPNDELDRRSERIGALLGV